MLAYATGLAGPAELGVVDVVRDGVAVTVNTGAVAVLSAPDAEASEPAELVSPIDAVSKSDTTCSTAASSALTVPA